MTEFFRLSTAERLDALDVAADQSGRLPHLLEKDIWVVWSLQHLFAGPDAGHLVFKGGTSLSKAYGVIRRFSEDVDLTYDIRAIAGDLVGDSEAPMPASKSQAKQWSKTIRARLSEWVRAERTFWEKATAMHVFCARGAFRGGDRFARHWHDVTRLDTTGFAAIALADRILARAVADHKSAFFVEKNTHGQIIDYHAAVAGGLQLVPDDDDVLATLATDYQQMVDDGLFLDDVESFETLLEHCRAIQQKANAIEAED
ncbi:MAG: nucleotidyl transferase AbiEii/AbiGii toxin family protein [Acidiferrobacteraceae bacterium]